MHTWRHDLILLCPCRTPQLNLQFTVRTNAGHVSDYFSQRMESHGDWQHVAVAYNAHDARAQFYINGFPVEPDTLPEVSGFCGCACGVVLALR